MHDIIADLRWRGLIHQITDERLGDWLQQESRTVYAGFDPTADSLHVGHLMPVLLLRRFQQAGHRPLAVVGGSTGMIGDPSGKSSERNLLDEATLRQNVDAIERQLQRLLDFDCGSRSALLLNNYDWTAPWSYLDFLREVGKNFPVNVMLSKDSVKTRLEGESGLSYTEFSYMLLQAYDFVHLNRQHGCLLQVGGTDQWGNITAGIDLGRRMGTPQLYGLTCPLLTRSDGAKMGKTESGAIWLSAQRTSPYAFFQYWINVADEDAGQCLRFLTDLSQDEIQSLDASRDSEPHRRESQKRLAEELTHLIHGDDGLAVAKRATDIFFGAEIEGLQDRDLLEIFNEVPSHGTESALLADGLPLVDALVHTQLAKSKSEARRIIKEGGAYINNRRAADLERVLTPKDLASDTVIVLRAGKRNYGLLKMAD